MQNFINLIIFLTCYTALPIIHVFGDSHAYFCFTNIKNDKDRQERSMFNYNNKQFEFNIHWLGPITMHRVGRDSLDILNMQKYNVKNNDTAVFVFGEIDVRCHILKQAKLQNKPTENIINTLVDNYINTILENRKQYLNVNCVVLSITPPIGIENLTGQWPVIGTLNERIGITGVFNKKLKEKCSERLIKFCDIYNIFALQDGSLNPEMASTVHINYNFNDIIKVHILELLNA